MRTVILLALGLVLFPFQFVAAASQEARGYGIVDISGTSDCQIHYSLDEADTATSFAVSLPCPAGTHFSTSPMSNTEANSIGAIFVPATGAPQDDWRNILAAQQGLLPSRASASVLFSEAGLADPRSMGPQSCTPASLSAGGRYRAYDPGVYIYYTLYYSRTWNCTVQVNSSSVSASWDGSGMQWQWSGLDDWSFYIDRGCLAIPVSGISQTNGYTDTGSGGAYYVDASINRDCSWQGGETYSGYVWVQ